MAKDGILIILVLIIISIAFVVGALITQEIFLKILVVISWLLILFALYFFRDPERNIPIGNNLIVSPADGTIISVEEVQDRVFFKTRVQQVSIFMSVFDVHVNRIPMDGQVVYFNYQQGKFHPAFKENASYENEQTIIVIENDRIKILMKQIAGILARRIVCHVREGRQVKQGERFGMIKFGSRIELLLPREVQLNIRQHDKVKAGESIIGTY